MYLLVAPRYLLVGKYSGLVLMMPKIMSKLYNIHVLETRLAKQNNKENPRRVPVRYWPTTLRKLSQRTLYNFRVPELE